MYIGIFALVIVLYFIINHLLVDNEDLVKIKSDKILAAKN